MGLRTKFNLVMGLAFLIGLGLAAMLSQWIVQKNARDEVLQNARIMMDGAFAVRSYTIREISPLFADQGDGRFHPHTVPSFAAQTNFRALREKYPEFTYKEAALNPTNPTDRASDWEADIIHAFRNNTARLELVSERETPTGRVMVLALPITIKDAACLTCHSVPGVAPPAMTAIYGSANGFGWQMGETVGAQLVTVPMSLPLKKAQDAFIVFMGALAVVFFVIIAILNVLLHYVVIKPVAAISRMATQVSMGQMDVPDYERKGSDEIAMLSASFNRMRRSLENALNMLND